MSDDPRDAALEYLIYFIARYATIFIDSNYRTAYYLTFSPRTDSLLKYTQFMK